MLEKIVKLFVRAFIIGLLVSLSLRGIATEPSLVDKIASQIGTQQSLHQLPAQIVAGFLP